MTTRNAYIRKPHEPYANIIQNGQIFGSLIGRAIRINGSRISRERNRNIESGKNTKEAASDFDNKKEPIKATAAYGSVDYIEGKDLIKIKPSASNFNQAITETSQPLKHEVMYIFDDKGNAMAAFGGQKRSVKADLRPYNYSATLHNHPRQYGSSNATFSPTDIDSYLSNGKKINHYVVTEKKVFMFNIGNMNMDNKNQLHLKVELNNRTDKLTAEMRKYIRTNNYTTKAYFEATERWHYARDNMMKDLAKEFGFEYSSTSIEDFKKKYNI